MKRIVVFILLLLFVCNVRASMYWPKPAYHKYQIGATFGVGNISAANSDFPGSHWGVFMRYNKHTCGFRREWDGEFLKMWGEPVYYERMGIYYGWSAAARNVQWGPQVGFGSMAYNHSANGGSAEKTTDTGVYGEVALYASLNVRGNGIGAKVFFNVNRFMAFAGATVYLQLGFAWNDRKKETTISQ